MASGPPHNGGHYNRYSSYGDPYRQYQASSNPSVSTMFPPNTDAVIMDIFNQADFDGSGTIDLIELRKLLSQRRDREIFSPFSPRTLRLMLHLFADTPDKTRIGRQGFVNLWQELIMWHSKFMAFDHNKDGTIDKAELQQALLSFHIPIPHEVLDILVRTYNHMESTNSIRYGEFVECGFIMKGLTEKFYNQASCQTNSVTFDYTSFMLLVIPFIAA